MTDAPTPRETADHAELARLAEAATPGDLDTVPNPPSEYGGHSEGVYECPACAGQGEVEGATYCNFDGLALGVQFFGIGNAFKNYEAYFRAANPARVLALLSEIAALRASASVIEPELGDLEATNADLSQRLTQAERQRAEAVGLLKRWGLTRGEMSGAGTVETATRDYLANQGTDQ